MMSVLIALVIELPIGTNLGLLRVLWTLVSGQLLATRGALIPALANLGLSEADVLRAWSAFANGSWDTHRLVMTWDEWVRREGHWERSEYGGYRVTALDLTGFFRPCLQHCPTRHYDSAAGKALKAIPLGIVGDVGRIGAQRFTLPRALVRAEVDHPHPSEAVLEEELVRIAVQQMAEDEALTADRGFKPVTFIKAGCTRVVLRRPKNFTARRRTAPVYGGRGRKPSRPAIVRPLPRTYRGQTLAATPPDRIETWSDPHSGVIVTAHVWSDVVLPDHPKDWDAQTRQRVKDTPWTIVLIFHPAFPQPMLLIMTIALSAPQAHAFYLDRWGIEHPPLVAKQMLGAAHQFVFAAEARQRLPELSLLAGSVLSYVAACEGAIPTGFWDRAPKSTPGRLRRLLTQVGFPADFPLPARLREKHSRTDHLPKGIFAHRRSKQAVSQSALDSQAPVCLPIQT